MSFISGGNTSCAPEKASASASPALSPSVSSSRTVKPSQPGSSTGTTVPAGSILPTAYRFPLGNTSSAARTLSSGEGLSYRRTSVTSAAGKANSASRAVSPLSGVHTALYGGSLPARSSEWSSRKSLSSAPSPEDTRTAAPYKSEPVQRCQNTLSPLMMRGAMRQRFWLPYASVW